MLSFDMLNTIEYHARSKKMRLKEDKRENRKNINLTYK
jgi:hypothetical protein